MRPASNAASCATVAAEKKIAAAFAAAVEPVATAMPSAVSTAISAAHTPIAARGEWIPYVASAARAFAPPAAFNPAAATSTSPRTRQTTTDTIASPRR